MKLRILKQGRLPSGMVGAVLALCCGNATQSPTSATPAVTQVTGVWQIAGSLTSISGGDCLNAILQQSVGLARTGTLRINQAGSLLTATSVAPSGATDCVYAGTAHAESMTLTSTSCSAGMVSALPCVDGQTRDLRFRNEVIDATVLGGTGRGTSIETWDVFSTTTGQALGPLTFNATLTATRQ